MLSRPQVIGRIKDEQLSAALRCLAVLGPLLLFASLARSAATGWQTVMWLHVGAYIVILGAALAANRLAFHVRAWILLCALFLLGAGGLATWALADPASIALFSCCIVSAMVFGRIGGAVATVLCTALICLVGVGVVTGVLSPKADLSLYVASPAAWILDALSLGVAAGLVISAQGHIDRKLTDLLQTTTNANHRLRQVNDSLAAEIAERKRLEEEERHLRAALQETCNELSRLNNQKDAFLSSISHELRTPLTSIRSFSEILLQYPDEDPSTRSEFLEIIKKESDRLSKIIDDLLDLSKIDKGTLAIRRDSVPLNHIVRKAIDECAHRLRAKSLILDARIHEDLPLVMGDEGRIRQVLIHLLSNAIKFSHEGGEITVSACLLEGKRLRDDSDWVQIAISDQGEGIEEKDLPHVFEPFYQVGGPSLTDKTPGTGIGLSLCRHIVESHGGDIWIESRKGHGTTVRFTLPLARGMRGTPVLGPSSGGQASGRLRAEASGA